MKENTHKNSIAVAVILLLCFSAVIMVTPQINAHTPPWTVPTYAYIVANENPTGANTQIWLTMWLDKAPPTTGGVGGDPWHGYTVAVTAPDGTTSTLGPFDSDPIGTKSTPFTPTQVGTYTLVFSYPGQTVKAGNDPEGRGLAFVGDIMQPSTSTPLSLVVQATRPAAFQDIPLPDRNTFWSRPLQGDIHGWSTLASNWLMGSQLYTSFQPYGAAPNSAHIVWAKVLAFGGMVGDQFGDVTYGTEDYESPWSGGIIMQGRLFYNNGMYPKYGYYCVDLQTGEQIWYQNSTGKMYLTSYGQAYDSPQLTQGFPQLSFGQLYNYYSLNGQGVVAYLWCTVGTTWYMLDALSGNWILTLTNVPGGTAKTASDGSLLRYSYTAASGTLLCWNSSKSIPPLGPTASTANQWKPRVGATINAVNDTSWTVLGPKNATPGMSGSGWTAAEIAPRSGYSLNVTASQKVPGSIIAVLADRVMVATAMTTGPTSADTTPAYTISALSLKAGEEGKVLWTKNYDIPQGNQTLNFGPMSVTDGIFTMWAKQTIQWYGYSLDTGALVWGPTASQGPWDMFGMGGNYAYGTLYSCGYGGVLYAYDMKAGTLKWTYSAPNVGTESPYGQYPLSVGAIADGKVFLYSTEHSPTKPLWRGSLLRAVDAYNGHEVWSIEHHSRGSIAVADGYLISADVYDGRIYCFGKGQTTTTVTAPEAVQPVGTQVLIKGTVLDQSAGAKDVPAVSDAYMTQWMEYVYKQRPIPGNAQGVTVKLSAVDANGAVTDIGTATTDLSGMYKVLWTPPAAGAYTIMATFEGSNSYFASFGETALGVSSASAATPTPAPTSTPVVSGTNATAPIEAVYVLAVVLALLIVVLAFVAIRKK